MKTVFSGGYVISGRRDCEAVRADVLVENGRIIKTGEVDKSGAEVIDCTGKYIMPGLVNLHAHLFGTGMPSKVIGGGSLQTALLKLVKTPVGHVIVDMLVSSALKTQLNSGVTTLRSSGDFECSDIRLREKINSGKAQGPRLICPGKAITAPDGHGAGTFADTATEPQELERLVDERKKAGADYIKICVTGGVTDSKRKGYPGEVKMTLEQTKAICDRAHSYNMKVASHTQSPDGMRVAILGGVDTLEHGAVIDDECVEILKERKGAVVPTFSPAYPLSALPAQVTKLSELCLYNSNVVMQGMIDGLSEAQKAGIQTGLGTDASCPFATHYGMWREIWYYWRIMETETNEAIYRGTLAGAEILGIDGETGSVEEGKSADLLILDQNPLSDLKAMKNPWRVVFRGDVIVPKIKQIKSVEEMLAKACDDLEKNGYKSLT